LRAYCAGSWEIEVGVADVRTALGEIERLHPALYGSVCDETGAVRRHINIFINTRHIRDREGLDTRLEPGDRLIILPSVSGG
jgi:molybdopterin converting factor small subunit